MKQSSFFIYFTDTFSFLCQIAKFKDFFKIQNINQIVDSTKQHYFGVGTGLTIIRNIFCTSSCQILTKILLNELMTHESIILALNKCSRFSFFFGSLVNFNSVWKRTFFGIAIYF